MSQWTNAARRRLAEYFARIRPGLKASGADENEVIDDLTRHVDEEVSALKLSVVTEEDVGQILRRIGAPDSVAIAPVDANRTVTGPEAPAGSSSRLKPPGWGLLFFGVLLPLGAVGFEFVTAECAALIFNPLPNLGHVVLTLCVPLANLLVWTALRTETVRWPGRLGWLNGFALAIAAVYAMLFLPLSPFALIGVLFYGFGLIPLAPLCAFIAALLLREKLVQSASPAPLPGLWRGLALGCAALLAVTLPMLVSYYGLRLANSESPAESARGIQWLRAWGNDEELLRACYGRWGRSSELQLYEWNKPVSAEAARAIYYRVTGRPFNAVPPPKLYAGRARWTALEEDFTWDNDQAGDAVAGRVRGLSLLSSRLDGRIEPEAALAYVEWTLEFRNDSGRAREARAQVALPPGGVVSRLTLWIDGQEREAAFGGRSQVKTAYKEVVQQRRDPVLVTTCGPDRVLMQCFPVAAYGGTMKVRLGITAPLALTNAATGFLRWPCFLERNFSMRDGFLHSLWMESPQPLAGMGGKLMAEPAKAGGQALRGQLSEAELSGLEGCVRVDRPLECREVWAADTRNGGDYLIRQSLEERPVPLPDRVVLVVDGSEGMKAFYPAIASALTRLPATADFAVLLANDGVQELSGPLHKAEAPAVRQVADKLQRARGKGGHDNVPALVRAWDLAGAGAAGVVVWIHGPQPMLFDPVEELRQRFERRPGSPRLLEIQAHSGPNRVVEKLDGLAAVETVVRLGELSEDLNRLFRGWNGQGKAFVAKRDRVPADTPGSKTGKTASLQLVRLWAAREIARLNEARQPSEAMRLAAGYQLVTPVSGAVVLESQAQYDRAGLQPVPPDSVPTVPEPSTTTLWLLGFVLLAWRRRQRRPMAWS